MPSMGDSSPIDPRNIARATTRSLRLALALLLASCGGTAPAPAAPAAPAGGRCGKDLGESPFQRKEATHILVADFFANRASEPDFADTISRQVDGELKRYRDELRDPLKMDLEVPEGSLEIQRLRCFVEDHDQARALAEKLGADLVVWGKAFCNPTPQVTVVDQGRTDIQIQGDVKTGNNSPVRIGTREVHAGKPYTVCPSATLYQRERDFRRNAERGLGLGSIGELDLPMLVSSEPFQLVHFTLGMHFYEKDMFPLAARFFKKSADNVLAGERNVETLELMLGRAYMELPDLKQALEYSLRALDRVQGTGREIEAALENNIGGVLLLQGDYGGALKHFYRTLSLVQTIYGPDHPKVSPLLNNIGGALFEQGDHKGALGHFLRALAIDEKSYAPDHPNVAIRLSNVGGVLHYQGDHRSALGYYRRALAIYENAYGSNHPDVANELNNIGGVLRLQGNHQGALDYYRRALSIREKVYGLDHPDVALGENNIGMVLRALGDHEKALEHLQRALVIDEKAYGPNHPHVARDENNIGFVLQARGHHKSALEHYRRALDINERRLGPEHPHTRGVRENIAATLAEHSGWKQDGKHPGAIVVRCVKADCSGLQSGDWLISYGPTSIRDSKHLRELVTSTPPDRPVTLTVTRAKKKLRLPAHGGPLGINLL
jgi:tetratricopeptide (TPR) repeat protein